MTAHPPTVSRVTDPSFLAVEHLNYIRDFYNEAPVETNEAGSAYRDILAHYYRLYIPAQASVLEIGCGSGELLARLPNKDITGIDLCEKRIARARERLPYGKFHVQAAEALALDRTYDYIVISDTLNQAADVQLIFTRLQAVATPDTRVVMNFFSALWRPLLGLAKRLGLKAKEPVSNWLGVHDVENLLAIGGWELVLLQPRILMPIHLGGLERLINSGLAPILAPLCLTMFGVARLIPRESSKPVTVSVVVPARNEAGNIEAAVRRTANMGAGTELIFVEGNSTDNTWAEIQRVKAAYPDRNIRILQQSGKGKGNAVRDGFAQATGEILMILDADLTMPPEELPKFYDLLVTGKGDFINGVRLVYPMEEKAMRFANLVANKAFSIIFTWLLDQPVRDTLCGTKVLRRHHYDAIVANRAYFGDFDPFGDFDLLFGAAKLNLKLIDLPIRYRERTYGETNIHRWRHGMLLLRMVLFAARKLKFI